MKYQSLIKFINALLILLFTYAAVSKLFEFDNFKEEMHNQAIPAWMANGLIWGLPASELVTAFLLITSRWRYLGMLASLGMLLVFTAYIGWVLIFIKERPCSCGGILKNMSWPVHLFFNLTFLLLSLTGIILINRERRVIGKD